MPLTKTYCKGSGLVVRHNDTLDKSTNSANWSNNCAGSTLGATPADDRGWSYASVNGWTESSLNSTIRAEYPDKQLPTFRNHSTLIKRSTDTFSQEHSIQATYPWFSSGSGTYYGRSESYTANAIVKNRVDQCFRFSIYKPSTSQFDPLHEHIIMQWHGGTGSPPISIQESQSGEFSLFIHTGSLTSSQVNIFIGSLTRDTWHNFICFVSFSQTISLGKVLLFKDGLICRTRVRSGSLGSYTYATGKTTKVTGTTGGSTVLNTDIQGNLPLESPTGDSWLLYYVGKTLASGQTISSIYPKWGIYKFRWDDYYNTTSQIVTNLGLGMDLEDALLKNPSDPLDDWYIPENLRESTIYTSIAFGYVGSGETFEDMYLLLSDGVPMNTDDRALIAEEPLLSWFTLNTVIPPVTDFNLTVTTTAGGSVNIVSGTYEEGDGVTLIATANEDYFFLDWINIATGITVSVLQTYSFNMPANNLNLLARFQLVTPPIPPLGQISFMKKPL